MAEKRVYFFGGGKAEGNATMKELLGGRDDQSGDSGASGFYHCNKGVR